MTRTNKQQKTHKPLEPKTVKTSPNTWSVFHGSSVAPTERPPGHRHTAVVEGRRRRLLPGLESIKGALVESTSRRPSRFFFPLPPRTAQKWGGTHFLGAPEKGQGGVTHFLSEYPEKRVPEPVVYITKVVCPQKVTNITFGGTTLPPVPGRVLLPSGVSMNYLGPDSINESTPRFTRLTIRVDQP